MKKNLLSVLVLVLVVVNIAMSAVMMISVTSTNKKTAELITSIATVLNLDLHSPGGNGPVDVPLADIKTYDDMTGIMIGLQRSVTINEDGSRTEGKQLYLVFDLSLQMNMKHEDYKTYGETIADRRTMILEAVTDVVSSHTEEDCRGSNIKGVEQEILSALQKLFGSDFIFKVSMLNLKCSG